MFMQSARDLAADIEVGVHTPGSLANLVPVIRKCVVLQYIQIQPATFY